MFIAEVTLNIYLLGIIVLLSALAGFSFRSGLLSTRRKKIDELEREVLNSNHQILDLERETQLLESQLQDIKSPVIAMKKPESTDELRVSKPVPDISLRKKLLGKKNIQSASGL